MDNKFYIKKFIRDDGQTLAFDAEEIYLAGDMRPLQKATFPDPPPR